MPQFDPCKRPRLWTEIHDWYDQGYNLKKGYRQLDIKLQQWYTEAIKNVTNPFLLWIRSIKAKVNFGYSSPEAFFFNQVGNKHIW